MVSIVIIGVTVGPLWVRFGEVDREFVYNENNSTHIKIRSNFGSRASSDELHLAF